MDTANDFRILMAERGIEELQRVGQSLQIQGRKKFLDAVKVMASEIQSIKYCYLPPEETLQMESLGKVVETASSLRANLTELKDYSTITADYWLEYIEALPKLIERGEISRAYEAIRFFAGEIVSRSELDGLWLCVFDCGERLEIVTNNEEFRQGRKAVVSYLPPKRFGRHVSRGMFVLADDRIKKKGELTLDEIRSLSRWLGEVEAAVISIIKK